MYSRPTRPHTSPISAYQPSSAGSENPNLACVPKIGLKPTTAPKIVYATMVPMNEGTSASDSTSSR